jgi:hypothetical protein
MIGADPDITVEQNLQRKKTEPKAGKQNSEIRL